MTRQASSESEAQVKTAVVAAAVVLVVYVLGLVWLIAQVPSPDPSWTRSVYIVNGIQALAFAGAGWLWGTQVGRGATEAERKRADEAGQQLQQTRGHEVAVRNELGKLQSDMGTETRRRQEAELKAEKAAGEAERATSSERDRVELLAMEVFGGTSSESEPARIARARDVGPATSGVERIPSPQLLEFLKELRRG